MFLMSLANILPRLASMTAFLCLVVAHLEWPDMPALPVLSVAAPGASRSAGALTHQVDERPVEPEVATHLGVEGRRQQRSLPDRHDPTGGRTALDPAEHLDARTGLLHPRSADEDA